jgi:hypothetical protein
MLRIERYGNSRFWALYDGQDLVVVTVYKRGAREVLRRLAAQPPAATEAAAQAAAVEAAARQAQALAGQARTRAQQAQAAARAARARAQPSGEVGAVGGVSRPPSQPRVAAPPRQAGRRRDQRERHRCRAGTLVAGFGARSRAAEARH